MILLLLLSQTYPGLEFLNMNIDGRVVSMGGASIGNASQGSIYFSPANLGEYSSMSFSTSYSLYLLGSHIGLVSGVIPLGNNKTLGFGLRSFYTGGIERRPEGDPWDYSYYSSYFIIANAGFGLRMEHIALGAGVNVGNLKIESSTGTGVFVNLGAKYIGENYSFGVGIDNLGMEILHTKLPITVKAGGGFYLLEERIKTIADITYTQGKGVSGCGGIGLKIVNMLSIMVGYNTGISSGGISGVSFGFGINTGGFSVNYAAIPGSPLGISHYFTFSFTPSKKEKIVPPPVTETFSKERMMSDKLVEQGISYYQERKFREALNYFDLSLIWNPNNEEAKKWMEKVEVIIKNQKLNEYIKMGKDRMSSRDYLNAAFYFNKALSIDSTNKEVLSLKRQVENLLKKGMKSSTKKDLEIALRYYRKGDYMRAISILSDLLKSEPGNAKIQEYINSAKKKMADEISSGLKKIDGYIIKGELKSASYHVDRLLKKYKNNEELRKKKIKVEGIIRKQVKFYIEKGKEDFNNGRIQEAEKNFQKVLEYDPRNKTALTYLEKIGRITVKSKKDEADRYYILGIEAYTKNNYELAIKYWEKVLKIYPGYPNAKENIERARLKLKELQKPE